MIFAIVKEGTVVNIVEADESTPFDVLFPGTEAILFTEESGGPVIGKKVINGKFQPYDSWTFDEAENKWTSPVPEPNDGLFYRWVEEDQTWQALGN